VGFKVQGLELTLLYVMGVWCWHHTRVSGVRVKGFTGTSQCATSAETRKRVTPFGRFLCRGKTSFKLRAEAEASTHQAPTSTSPYFASGHMSSLPKLEHAKTGRSSCRKCGEGIDAGELRVGIEAW